MLTIMSIAYLVLIPLGIQNYRKKEREDRLRQTASAKPSDAS
jgi:hypothetical protein